VDARAVLILGADGYIGSALAPFLRERGLSVTGIDNGFRSSPTSSVGPRRNFRDLTEDEFAPFGNIILLAGHPSVSACDRQPRDAFNNNVDSFVGLVHKLRGQKLLFASSISLYVRTPGVPAIECQPMPAPVSFYDMHKQMIEQYARIAYPNHFALRFGTLCGPSPNIRLDLMLNSMVWSALSRKKIEVANRDVHRPLLGITDLCRAIATILTSSIEPGPYNLASVNTAIGQIADYVAGRFGVPCIEVERPTAYDIAVSTEKFTRAANFAFADTIPTLVDSLDSYFARCPSPR